MGLESVTYIKDLNELWPLGSDPKSAGDDHIRRIKLALKNTFPNADSVISATPAELNALVGITTGVQTQINAVATPAIGAIAPLTPAADKLPYFTSASAAAVTDLTAFARTLLDDMNQTAALATLGALINAVEAKSAPFVVAAGDRGKLLDCTGTWTMGLLAASGNAGFAFAVRNSGAGTITVDPSGSEQIDGANTIALAAGESCLIVCDGTGWKTVGRPLAQTAGVLVGIYARFTSGSGLTAVRPAGATKALIKVQGGGGAGGVYLTGVHNGGGGAGGYAEALRDVSTNLTVVVGAAGGASLVTNGVWTIQANGGGAGGSNAAAGPGGTASGGDLNLTGQSGSFTAGGSNLMAHGGVAVGSDGNGIEGMLGGGGYGPGGAGSPGWVLIYWYK